LLIDVIRDQIRSRGPLTAAAFIDLALYHPESGYYARAGQRSGRGGDFFTSVDVGALFGELLAVQLAECLDVLNARGSDPQAGFQLVEAGAGNGRLARDILDTLERDRPDLYARIAVNLVERSPLARAAQPAALGPHARMLAGSGADMPEVVTGVVYANELLDAFPVHIVVMRDQGLREVFVDERDGELVEIEGEPTTPALQAYVDRLGLSLAGGARAEINLAAVEWIAAAARSIERGFLILIDYGHEAVELFSGSHATGTLTTFSAHRDSVHRTDWLRDPGGRDITSHVDLTSVRRAAEEAGLTTLGFTDQTYFLLGLGLLERVASPATVAQGSDPAPVAHGFSRANQAKTLMLPGGLGSTHKVMVFGKNVGKPPLKGLSYRVRVT
jgi:SAM-dependent MidA family methyltransferase